MTIQVNGESQTVNVGTTIANLLENLGHNPRYLAVEQNRCLVRRAEHAQCILQANDIIEIVTLVGGG
ncbi:MAG: sulfur carrier protein ThiS [Planctomycetaceae bacterium]|nr:sulfur carrier protein ThiS [Planctomycetaceae bacterium]